MGHAIPGQARRRAPRSTQYSGHPHQQEPKRRPRRRGRGLHGSVRRVGDQLAADRSGGEVLGVNVHVVAGRVGDDGIQVGIGSVSASGRGALEAVDVQRHDHVAILTGRADVDVGCRDRLDALDRQIPANLAGVGVDGDVGCAGPVLVACAGIGRSAEKPISAPSAPATSIRLAAAARTAGRSRDGMRMRMEPPSVVVLIPTQPGTVGHA